MAPNLLTKERCGAMSVKYISFDRKDVYAIIYRNINLVYYNLDFMGETQLYIMHN